MKFLIIFIALSIVNVVFSTIRSITTIRSGKVVASLVSGGYFAFYNIVLIYTVMDFPMWQKCLITFLCNIIGVWIVKFIEEKMRKEKLWKIEMTIKINYSNQPKLMQKHLIAQGIPNNYIIAGKYAIFNCYCQTSKDTEKALKIGKLYCAKTFASECQKIF